MIYFVRHGQTDANLKQIHCGGEWDLPLNDNGRAQAQAVAIEQEDLISSFDHVFVSPMRRAQETARLVTQEKKNLLTVNDLREWELGKDSGEPISEALPPFLESLKTPREGETFEEFQNRCLTAFRDIASQVTGQTLIVAHGGVWACYAHFVKRPTLHLGNCVIEKIDINKL